MIRYTFFSSNNNMSRSLQLMRLQECIDTLENRLELQKKRYKSYERKYNRCQNAIDKASSFLFNCPRKEVKTLYRKREKLKEALDYLLESIPSLERTLRESKKSFTEARLSTGNINDSFGDYIFSLECDNIHQSSPAA